jgi:3-hydroxyisobutyrate dehydrogenase-like beta-hydroxyacid dehydrogenase
VNELLRSDCNLKMSINGHPPQAKVVGYIGIGNAGFPLASTLARAGYFLVVQDADPSRGDSFAKEHPKSSRAVAAGDVNAFNEVDVLVTMLPNGEIVRDVLLGSTGVAKGLKEGSVVIDTSSASPFHTRETAAMLKDVNPGVTLIDSPVTQEYAFALAKGDATLMVGCSSQNALDLAMPVLKTMGKHVFVMGELGAGHAMKTLNNYTSAASIMGLCDALVAGQKFGLDPAKMVDVMNVGTGEYSVGQNTCSGTVLIYCPTKLGVNFSTKESFRTDVSQHISAKPNAGSCSNNKPGTYQTICFRVPVEPAAERHENRENID